MSGVSTIDLQEGGTLVNCEKYIGLDVHQATISVAVMDPMGKVIMESILETKASTILEFLGGLRGTLSVTFEEGTWAAWLYDCMSRRKLMYSVGTNPPEEKSDLCSLDRIRGGNEANAGYEGSAHVLR